MSARRGIGRRLLIVGVLTFIVGIAVMFSGLHLFRRTSPDDIDSGIQQFGVLLVAGVVVSHIGGLITVLGLNRTGRK